MRVRGGQLVCEVVVDEARQQALVERIKLMLGVDHNDYCPAIGIKLLAPFSEQETNRAYYALNERGWVAGHKKRPGDEPMVHHRRYKLSGKYQDTIAPHRALSTVHAAAPLALAARFRRDGMQDMQEALGLALRPVEWAPVHPV